MKHIFLCLLLLMTQQAFSQKKGKVDPKDAAIDSLTQVTTLLTAQLDSTTKSGKMLSMQLDSISKKLATFQGMYNVIKEKVVLHDFDPAKADLLIDSLKNSREVVSTGLTSNNAALTDSVNALVKENKALKENIANLQAEDANKEKLVAELKQLKELLDAKIITQVEFDEQKAKLMAKW